MAGLPSLYADYVAACTYEGENNVMCLQTARSVVDDVMHVMMQCSYLLKAWHAAQSKQRLAGQLQYLNTS